MDGPVGVAAHRPRKRNDVGYRIWPGNYGMYLDQYDPNGTSQGYWRQGSKDQPYGRFARGFRYAAGKNDMDFDIDDDFFFDQPLDGEYAVTVNVIYLDEGTGTWALDYDAQGNPAKRACTVTKTGSGQWKTKSVVLTDAYFGNRCPHGTDLMLVNTDDKDDIFHIVEITRKTGDRRGYWGGSRDAGILPGVTTRIAHSMDDAEERLNNGTVTFDSTDLELVRDDDGPGAQLVGLRFPDINILPGSTIDAAWLTFQTDEADSETTALVIRAQDSDTAAPFVDEPGNLSGRPRTSAHKDWAPDAWGTLGKLRDTPDLAAVIQEVVDRPGWQTGNAIAILISGTGKRTVESYDGEPAGAPLLNIEYTPPPPPAAPSQLSATALSHSQIRLAWQDNSNDEALFKIDRRRSMTSAWVRIAQLDPDTTSCQDTGVSPETTFYYKVKAGNATLGNSAYTDLATVTTPAETIAAPSDLRAQAASSSQIELSWQDRSANETGFRIERRQSGILSWVTAATAAADATACTDTGLLPATKYYYTVTAHTAYTDSAPSGTELTDMQGNYSCVFLRRTFQVQNPAAVRSLALDLLYDDGFVLWLNGQEIARRNIAGTAGSFFPYDGTAAPASGDREQWTAVLTGGSLPVLHTGENLLALQVFNWSLADSSDCTAECYRVRIWLTE